MVCALSPKEQAAVLAAAGMNPVDAQCAGKLGSYIEKLDQWVFPDNPIRANLIYGSDTTIASYRSPELGAERYLVHTNGIGERCHIERSIMADNLRYAGLTVPGVVSEQLCLGGIAIHEVRHRFQYQARGSMRLWTPKMCPDGPLGRILGIIRDQLMWKIHAAVAAGELAAVKRHYEEFDALVVELHAQYRMHDEGQRAAPELVRFQPDESICLP